MTAVPSTLEVISRPDRAASVLDPLRQRLLSLLVTPDSASGLARQLGLRRQKINYHLRELEEDGFVRVVQVRRKGTCLERIVQATARTYVISPEVMGAVAGRAGPGGDRFSSSYLIAVAADLIREVAVLRQRARRAKQELPTLTLTADVRFRSASDRGAFAEELAQTLARLAAKYHDDRAPDGRLYRFMIGGHPAITKKEGTEGLGDKGPRGQEKNQEPTTSPTPPDR